LAYFDLNVFPPVEAKLSGNNDSNNDVSGQLNYENNNEENKNVKGL